jgi:hypothetical protein
MPGYYGDVSGAVSPYASENTIYWDTGTPVEPADDLDVAPKTAADILADFQAGNFSSDEAAIAALELLGYTNDGARTFLGLSTGIPTATPGFVGTNVGGAPVSSSLLAETPEGRREADLLALIQDPERAFQQLFDTSIGQPGTLLNRSSFNFLGEPAKAGFRLAPFLRDIAPENLGSFQLADFVGGGLPSQTDIVNAFRAASGDPTGLAGSQKVRAESFQQDPSQEMQELMFSTAFGPWLARRGTGYRNELSRFLERQFNRFRQESPGLGFLQELGQNRLPQFAGFGGF